MARKANVLRWALPLTLGWTLLAWGWSGCGGSDEPEPLFQPDEGQTAGGSQPAAPQPVQASGDTSVVATVGPAGGTLQLSNGAELEIPPGALGSEVEVVFGLGARTQAFDDRETDRPVGPTLLIQPAIVAQPGTRVTVSTPMGPIPQPWTEEDIAIATEEVDESAQRAEVMGSTVTRWQYGPASMANGRIEADLGELSGMRLQFLLSQ